MLFWSLFTNSKIVLVNNRTQRTKIQKQPPRGVLIKRCSENMQQIYRINCSPVNLLFIFRTSFPTNTSGGLPLKIKECFSNKSKMEYGVPQGWILSPLLFYINFIDIFYEWENSVFLYVYKQTFHISPVRISQQVNSVIMRNLRHNFYVKTKILGDFHICISVL